MIHDKKMYIKKNVQKNVHITKEPPIKTFPGHQMNIGFRENIEQGLKNRHLQ